MSISAFYSKLRDLLQRDAEFAEETRRKSCCGKNPSNLCDSAVNKPLVPDTRNNQKQPGSTSMGMSISAFDSKLKDLLQRRRFQILLSKSPIPDPDLEVETDNMNPFDPRLKVPSVLIKEVGHQRLTEFPAHADPGIIPVNTFRILNINKYLIGNKRSQ
jgi:hypothetical protein